MNVLSDLDRAATALARAAALPAEMVEALFARYGRPLDRPDEALLDPVIALSDGTMRVGRFRHRAAVDVIASDYFVLERPGGDRMAVPGPLFTAAVEALHRAVGSKSDADP